MSMVLLLQPCLAADAPAAKRIAVMNFNNRNADAQWQWLSKGLADMLITDLSACEELTVVERERLWRITEELGLEKLGLLDSAAAAKAGGVAMVDWVLFGSFLKEGDSLRIETHILDLDTQELLRVEWVQGQADEVVRLEKRLVDRLLQRLNVPLTDQERRSIRYVPTDSISALEHYSLSLDMFDRGKWFESLLQCRFAVREDADYIAARARMADLYYELNKPEHALVEYRRLVAADKSNTFPEHIYYKTGRLLEERHKDIEASMLLYRKVLARHPEYDRVFDESGKPLATVPVVKITDANPRYSLGCLDRLARGAEQQGDKVEAARRYWQLFNLYHVNKYSTDNGALGDLLERSGENFHRLYLEVVQDNRDSIFPPCEPLIRLKGKWAWPSKRVIPVPPGGAKYDEQALEPCYYDDSWLAFLAPPNMEIDTIRVRLNTDTARNPAKGHHLTHVEVDFSGRSPGYYKQVSCNSGWRLLEHTYMPGIRHTIIGIHARNAHPEVEVTVRPWSPEKTALHVAKGRYSLRAFPNYMAKMYLNGQERKWHMAGWITDVDPGDYVIKAVWPDGSTWTEEFVVESEKITNVFLHGGGWVHSRATIDDKGCHPFAFADNDGKAWVLWDHSGMSSFGSSRPDGESDLYCATSADGTNWTQPRRLELSSSDMDMNPVLQQDGRGTYWMIWNSSRDPSEPYCLWIASSEDGVKWSFPAKFVMPDRDHATASFRKSARRGAHRFMIDRENTFWLKWQYGFYTSQNGSDWKSQPDPLGGGKKFTWMNNQRFSGTGPLACGDDNSLRALMGCGYREPRNDGSGRTRNITTYQLVRHNGGESWKNMGDIIHEDLNGGAALTVCLGRDVIAYITRREGLFIRSVDAGGKWSEPIHLDSSRIDPAYPSIAATRDGKVIVAYSCTEGIKVKVCKVP
jgi:TolB-like protein